MVKSRRSESSTANSSDEGFCNVVVHSFPRVLGPGVCLTKNDDIVACLGSFVIGECLLLGAGIDVIGFSAPPDQHHV